MTKEECLEILAKFDEIETNKRIQIFSVGSPWKDVLAGGNLACPGNTVDVLKWISEVQEFLAALTLLVDLNDGPASGE